MFKNVFMIKMGHTNVYEMKIFKLAMDYGSSSLTCSLSTISDPRLGCYIINLFTLANK